MSQNWGAQMERARVKEVYPTKTWAKKVDQMSDNQVIAIFLRLKREGKIK